MGVPKTGGFSWWDFLWGAFSVDHKNSKYLIFKDFYYNLQPLFFVEG